jgi:amidase/aspartyl-tRNA(Asn)/glutamyl-tRNA(Gln) amidotransferase subunit A
VADELAYVPAAELAARIRRRELSAAEAVETCIDRIESRNDEIAAFVYCGFDEARLRARKADAALAAGEEVGPLHGVPTAIKDLLDSKPGWPTTHGGIRALADHVVDYTTSFPEYLERAGAIVLGKTNSPVMGFRGTCDNYLFGPTRNPFDPRRNSGGSSGGSAAAVAAGFVPFAQGSDGGGSVRIPASWCGVYGFKPSFGRGPFRFDGPLTRTVADAALVLGAVAGHDPRDPFSLDDRVDFAAALDGGLDGLRIAYSPDLDVFPVDPRVGDAVAGAVRALEQAGARVEQVRLGLEHDQRALSNLWCRLAAPASVEFFESFERGGLDLLADHRDDFPPEYLRWVEEGYRLTAADTYRDQQVRTEVYDAVQRVLDAYELLVSPTVACLPVENAGDGNTLGPSEVAGVAVDPLIGWCLTYPFNFTGHPAASVPAGLVDGLPVGMQIVGRRYADAEVLAASAAFERLRPWHETYGLLARAAGGTARATARR